MNLNHHLEKLALERVEDKTSLNRPDEGSAWIICWTRARELSQFTNTNGTNSIQPQSASHIQLSSQPESYRGKPVKIDGWIRAARKMNVTRNELGIEHYYVLWVRPADTNVAPYCVYAESLPDGFPEIRASFSDLNERVSFDAIFYKIRSYTAAGQSSGHVPDAAIQSVRLESGKRPR